MNEKQNRVLGQVILAGGAFVALILLIWNLAGGFSNDQDAPRRANSTRTALALTERALLGPFPTPTSPTRTPSKTPTVTSMPTRTLTAAPSPTPVRYFITTENTRTRTSNKAPDAIPSSTAPGNTNPPPIPPTVLPPPPIPSVSMPPTPCLNPQGHPIPCH